MTCVSKDCYFVTYDIIGTLYGPTPQHRKDKDTYRSTNGVAHTGGGGSICGDGLGIVL